MKTIPTALKNHMALGTTTLAQCWKLERVDGAVFGFTDHDVDIVVDGITYLARTGFTPTAVQSQPSLAVSNLNANGILDSTLITEEDLIAGKWDFSAVEIFLVNYTDVSQGIDVLVRGNVGEVTAGNTAFQAEIRGLANAYAQSSNQLYQPGCRASLGDSKCKVNLTPFTFTGSVGTISVDNLTITDATRTEANGFFDYGKITMTSGLAAGLSMEIKSYVVGSMTLQLDFALQIAVGDTYSIHTGCGKRFDVDCVGRYNNGINFRGEPFIPGTDKILLFGGQR